MTLSIVGRCSITGKLGACVTTNSLAVGNRVPHVRSNIGAICTQARTNISYGTNGLKLLELGFSPQTALEAMLKEDKYKEFRQVIIIDSNDKIAAFTGKSCKKRNGHLIGNYCAVAGNGLRVENVLERVADEFKKFKGELSYRLLNAINVGETANGDRLGRSSAALLVAKPNQSGMSLHTQLRVDFHKDPVKKLIQTLKVYRPSKQNYEII
jgi:uncharacterized Ntn-hydrolase superfamily protein